MLILITDWNDVETEVIANNFKIGDASENYKMDFSDVDGIGHFIDSLSYHKG